MSAQLRDTAKDERISGDDLASFNFAIGQLKQAKAALMLAQGGVDTLQRYLVQKYELKEKDGIDIDNGGLISRESVPKSESPT